MQKSYSPKLYVYGMALSTGIVSSQLETFLYFQHEASSGGLVFLSPARVT
jgi:hypothetical protein